jgi:fused signal recognition particle receptor
MFNFLKDKLKGAIQRITKKVEEEAPEKEVEIEIPVSEPKKEIQIVEEPKKEKKKLKEKPKKVIEEDKVKEKIVPDVVKKESVEEKAPEKIDVKTEILEEKKEEKHGLFGFLKKKKEEVSIEEAKQETKTAIIKEEPKKGLFQTIKEKVTTKVISEKQFEDLFWELEVTLLENNVALEVIEKIKNDLKQDLTTKPIKRDKVEEEIIISLKSSIEQLLDINKIDLLAQIKEKKEKPYVIVFFGINGSGKTTTIAKLANLLKKNNISCILAASDTFRAAAIQQLEEHGSKIGVKVIKQEYNSDPAAVAFDAIKSAKAKNIDVVLIDTAGRLHSNINLLDEMKKIVRVAKPDFKIFVGESITGNDVTEQAKSFNESIGIDGIILTKADVDEKGGAMISISYVTKKPILYLGFGQSYDNLEKFNKEKIVSNLGL